MSTITQLRIWNDPGFTENCLEVPKKGASLPSPSFTIAGPLNPSKGRMFTSIQVREDYVTLMNASYVSVGITMNNSADLTLYGWVDSVVLESDTDGYPMTTINWHIDYWRTYISKAEFGSGMVRRRPLLETDTIPPQEYPYRYLEYIVGDTRYISKSNIWWVIFNVTTSGETSEMFWKCFPVSNQSPGTRLAFGNSPQCTAPSLNDVINGEMDELLQLNPDSIGYAFISPLPPSSYSGSGTTSDPIMLTNWSIWYNEAKELNTYQSSGNPFYPSQTNFTSTETMSAPSTTDVDVYMVMDLLGNPVGTLPWGFTPLGARSRIICDGTSACVVVSMYENVDVSEYELASPSEGLSFTISLPSIPVTSNAWSSYVYSGSRQAEMDARRLQAESQAVSGGISTGTSAISGAVSGALLGSAAGPVGMLGGALIGAVASAGTSLISTGANYAYQTGSYADEMQSISDYKASHQANNLILNGGSFDCCFNRIEGIAIVHMRKDEYSVTQRDNDISLYGVNVSEPMESCQALVNAGGPLQITNLTVTGDIPVEAKQFFRTRLAKGVRMI